MKQTKHERPNEVMTTSNTSLVKGSDSFDWGMKNRLARIFRSESGKTVMFAIDHGYFEGPSAGLEQVDVAVAGLLPYADALMVTRGVLRSSIPASFSNAVVLRASGGPSVLKELSNEKIAVDMEDALRLNVSALAVGVFIGGEFETQTVQNMTRLVDLGNRHGVPVLAVTGVGDETAHDAQYFRMACRICAELGAHFVKTYFVEEDFDKVTSACPVPVVIAGGKKVPALQALTMAYRAVQAGASGVDMGRNIFQSDAPVAMIQAVRAVVHGGEIPTKAFELYESLKNEERIRETPCDTHGFGSGQGHKVPSGASR